MIKGQCIRVKKHEGCIVWDMRQTFDFVAIGVICAECLVFKGIISAFKLFSNSLRAGFWMRGSCGQRPLGWGSAINSLPLNLGLFALSEAANKQASYSSLPACATTTILNVSATLRSLLTHIYPRFRMIKSQKRRIREILYGALPYSFEIVAAVALATLRIQLCSEATKKM